MRNRLFLLSLFILSVCLQGIAQPARQLVQVIVIPDKSDWSYEKGEQPQFQIMVLKNNVPLDGIDVKYSISPELMDAWEEKTVTLRKGIATIKAKQFKEAGFLRCHASVEVDGVRRMGSSPSRSVFTVFR